MASDPDNKFSSIPSQHDPETRTNIIVPPPTLRSSSHRSTLSSDSRSNLVDKSSSPQCSSSGALPFYWASSSQQGSDTVDEPRRIGARLANLFQGWRIIILGSWLNILLVLIPISWALSITMPNSHGLVFVFCILALVPLVKLHDLSTHELALRIGGSKTGLINASMSNIVEIVVAISALRKCELRVVQSSLIGSMLSKLLLVLGLCFFAGGMRFSEQGFDATATQIHSSLLSISVGAVLLPAAYHFSLSGASNVIPEWQTANILHMSHSVSVVLLFIYSAYLLFQLWSHSHLYNDDHNKRSRRLSVKVHKEHWFSLRAKNPRNESCLQDATYSSFSNRSDDDLAIPPSLTPPRRLCSSSGPSWGSSSQSMLPGFSTEKNGQDTLTNPTVRLVYGSGGHPMTRAESNRSEYSRIERTKVGRDEKEDLEIEPENMTQGQGNTTVQVIKEPRVSWLLTILLLFIVTITASVTADWLVESMDGISTTISKEWIGLILLPAVTSIAECMTAVNVSVKDQLTLSISVAVGSTIQTALFVIPFMITLAWSMGKPLSLLMDPFESLVLYISVQTMSYVVADGKSNWLEGVILICLYIIIAVSFWFYPGSNLPTSLAVCSIPA